MFGCSKTSPRFPARRIGFALTTLAVTTFLDILPFGRVGDAHAAGSLTLVSRAYRDLDGAIATLVSGDSDVACIIEPTVRLGSVPAGGTVTVGSLDPAQEGLSFRAGAGLQSPSAADPARLDLCLIVVAAVPEAFQETVCASYPGDLDLAGDGQLFIPGPDGIIGTADDGILLKDFNRDRNGDGALSKDREFYRAAPGVCRAVASGRAAGRPVPRPDRLPGAPDPATDHLPVAADRILQGPRGRSSRISTHPGRRGPASRRSVTACPLTLPAARGPAPRAAAGAAGSSGSPWGRG